MDSGHLPGVQHREVPPQSLSTRSLLPAPPRAGGTQGCDGRVQTPAPSPADRQRAPVGFQGGTCGISALSLGQWPRAGRVAGAPPSSGPDSSVLNPRARAPRPLGSAERASGQRGAGGARVPSQGRRQLAGMAPAAASGGSSLPSGFSVFVTFPDLLFIFEFVSGSAPCAGKGTGWDMLLTPARVLHRCPRPHQQHGGDRIQKVSPSLGGLFLSKIAD